MRVRIGDGGPTGEDLTGRFARWLAGDRTVGRQVTMNGERPDTAAGGMSGAPLEWIGLGLSTGFSAASLVYAHLGFRAALPPRERSGARMVVEHDGVRIVIEDGGPEDVARLARLLGSGGEEPGAGPGTAPGPGTPPGNGDRTEEETGGTEGGAA
ncbi:effector-associated constant component EACC1 [Streptomyces phytophilus]|uniref:effector-associated constant component EACC1 n=1 Tax=Streptomyces phytophilus TaxID=722715 RepID=UPI0015EFFE31|nr:hypothetical protein [Streptomyces phytophilus]